MASSYSSNKLIHEIIIQFISFISNNNLIDEEIKNKYKKLETLSSDYLQKNLQKLTYMIKIGIYESSINEFKKIISFEKYPIAKGDLPVNQFALNLVILVRNVCEPLIHCCGDETVSKIFLDNLNLFNKEIEKSMENKKVLNEEEKKQFKRDFIFIKKNINIGNENSDFKGFKNKLTNIYQKLDH